MTESLERGRPKGTGRPASFDRYKLKRWQPEFDWIVFDSVAGMSNKELGLKYGYTPQHISNILCSEQANELKARIREKSNEEFEGGLKDRLGLVGAKVVEHLENFIKRDELAVNQPFSFIDRALKIGQVVGTLLPDNKGQGSVTNNTIVQGNAVIAQGEGARDLAAALTKSMELEDIKIGDKIEDRLGESKAVLRIG